MAAAAGLRQFVVKVASRCNLNCSYCYVYNQADTTWRDRPSLMSHATWDATIERIRRHCLSSGRRSVEIVLHGGEPTLIGAERLASMCGRAREHLDGVATLFLTIQTNATRLDPVWISTLREHGIAVGVSLDGPKEVNDRYRVDRKGGGSHGRVVKGIDLLREGGMPFGILSVVA
ncbi:MAG TPA: radical SAM protein, partial [Solirubrobacteraceae bacterium]